MAEGLMHEIQAMLDFAADQGPDAISEIVAIERAYEVTFE